MSGSQNIHNTAIKTNLVHSQQQGYMIHKTLIEINDSCRNHKFNKKYSKQSLPVQKVPATEISTKLNLSTFSHQLKSSLAYTQPHLHKWYNVWKMTAIFKWHTKATQISWLWVICPCLLQSFNLWLYPQLLAWSRSNTPTLRTPCIKHKHDNVGWSSNG